MGRRKLIGCLIPLALVTCVADPKPDIPQDVGSVDAARMRVNPGSEPNEVVVVGLDGAATDGTRVQVQNLRTGTTVSTAVSSAGTFSALVNATQSQVLGVQLEADGVLGSVVYVAGGGAYDAISLGDDADCEELDDDDDDGLDDCLQCTVDDETVLVGCDLADFSSLEPVNPSNVAECLFVSDDFVELELDEDVEVEFGDVRFAAVNLFNGCGEEVRIRVNAIEAADPDDADRFEVEPNVDEDREIGPTFFETIEIIYDGDDRVSEETLEAEITVEVFFLDEDDEDEPLGEFTIGVLVDEE